MSRSRRPTPGDKMDGEYRVQNVTSLEDMFPPNWTQIRPNPLAPFEKALNQLPFIQPSVKEFTVDLMKEYVRKMQQEKFKPVITQWRREYDNSFYNLRGFNSWRKEDFPVHVLEFLCLFVLLHKLRALEDKMSLGNLRQYYLSNIESQLHMMSKYKEYMVSICNQINNSNESEILRAEIACAIASFFVQNYLQRSFPNETMQLHQDPYNQSLGQQLISNQLPQVQPCTPVQDLANVPFIADIYNCQNRQQVDELQSQILLNFIEHMEKNILTPHAQVLESHEVTKPLAAKLANEYNQCRAKLNASLDILSNKRNSFNQVVKKEANY
jgi:hypothetical protein